MRKTQTILGVTVVLIIGLLFFFGIMGIWLWGDNQIAKRQPPYNQSRVAAGTLKKSSSSSGEGVTLEILLAEKSELEAEIAELESSIESSIAELEASKEPYQNELIKYETEKALLETERSNLETEKATLEAELAKLQQSCRGWYRDSCQDRIDAIRNRLRQIDTRIAEIDDRINNFLIPKINYLQGIIDEIDAAIAALEDEATGTKEDLEKRLKEIEDLIAALEESEDEDPEAKDLYWPVYDPDELTEEDVFGLQKQE